MVHLPTIFCMPPTLLPKPVDWPRWHWVPGTLLLNADQSTSASEAHLAPDLEAFLARAGDTVPPVVCVTFGSMVLER